MYPDKLDDTVNEYNNKHHRIIKMKSTDVKPSIYIDFKKENKKEVLNLNLVIMLEYQKIKIFLQNTMFQIGLKKHL